MGKPIKKIVLELPFEVVEQLYNEYLKKAFSKEDAIRFYLESTLPEIEPILKDDALDSVKLEAKKLIAKNLGEAIEYLKSKLDVTSNEYDDLIGISSKFNRTFEFLHKGIIDYPTADQEFVKIGYAVLQILKGLSSEHLK